MDTTNERQSAGEVARRALVFVGVLLLADSGLTALVIRLSQTRSAGLLSQDAYSRVFAAHGALLFALFPALLLMLARLRRQAGAPSRGFLYGSGWVAWGAVLVAALVTGVGWLGVVRLDDRSSMLAVAAFALAPVCAAVHLTLELWTSERTAGLIAIALASWSFVFGLSTSWVTQGTTANHMSMHLAIAALGAVHDNLLPVDRLRDRLAFVALFGAGALPVLYGFIGLLVSLPLGFALSIRVVRAGFGRPDASRGERAFAALSALTFGEALLGDQFLRGLSVDAHFHDTLFSVAVYHLAVSSALFAAVALLYGRAPNVAPRGVSAPFAAVMALVGSHLFHFGFAIAGIRGMPRRYVAYLEEFRTLHVVATVGSFLLVAGLALGLSDALRPARDRAFRA